MNDRELLELAAKAAGQEVWTDIDGNLYSGEPERCWNPLTDDGDALRLAVRLAIDVNHGGFVVVAERRAVFDTPEVGAAERFISSDEAYAATRRAIVRAAAEIGRAMP